MTVTVLLFARLREMAGADKIQVPLGEHAKVVDLRTAIAESWPGLAGLVARSAVAVNGEYAEDEAILKPGDEVALIPPVSGGQ